MLPHVCMLSTASTRAPLELPREANTAGCAATRCSRCARAPRCLRRRGLRDPPRALLRAVAAPRPVELARALLALRVRRVGGRRRRRVGLQAPVRAPRAAADGRRDGRAHGLRLPAQREVRPHAGRVGFARGLDGAHGLDGRRRAPQGAHELARRLDGRRVALLGLHRARHAARRRRQEAAAQHVGLRPGGHHAVLGHHQPVLLPAAALRRDAERLV
mmetsp:Transcript_12481/g.42469  ORF Transcript_12481/g.42469 Transcript_12481/m.42469 type:complete len:217 (+) Transcript_12481:245-895(+)